jgi:hypothetical protein
MVKTMITVKRLIRPTVDQIEVILGSFEIFKIVNRLLVMVVLSVPTIHRGEFQSQACRKPRDERVLVQGIMMKGAAGFKERVQSGNNGEVG